MDRIEEKNIAELVQKNKTKKFKFRGKKFLLGVFSLAVIMSLIPTVEYTIAHRDATNNPKIEDAMDSPSDVKVDKIAQLYAEAINSNPHIAEELKEDIIQAFTENVINNYGLMFLDSTVINMYAVASTQRVKALSEFELECLWYTGCYTPYNNTITIPIIDGKFDTVIFSHEQIHAMLKNGLFGNGFAKLFYGYAINEAITAAVNNEGTYLAEQKIFDALVFILGYENIMEDFFSSDLGALKKELANYLPADSINRLFLAMDLNLFEDYYRWFLSMNYITPYSYYDATNIDNRNREIAEILENLFESKFHTKMRDSNLGRLIMHSNNCNGIFMDNNGKTYTIRYISGNFEVEFSDYYIPGEKGNSKGENVYVSYEFSKDEINDVDIDVLSANARVELDRLMGKDSINARDGRE